MLIQRIAIWVPVGCLAVACAGESDDYGGFGELGESTQAVVQATPGRIQAEDYERFFDSDTIHRGDCGSGPVDIQTTTDVGGGCNVGWTAAGEWLEYDFSLSEALAVDISARVASGRANKTLRIEIDGQVVGASYTVANAGWQSYEDAQVATGEVLSAGQHTLRVVFETGGVNLNYIDIDKQGPAVPGRVEAEDYTAFSDTTPANVGGQCDRGDGVDMQLTSDTLGGNCNIGWSAAGEYLEYQVYSATAQSVDIRTRVASARNGKTFRISVNGTDLGQRTAPNQGWQQYQYVDFNNAALSAGANTVRLTFTTGGVNFNFLEFVTQAAGPDTDGDGLSDAVETNTGVYVGPNDTGTDPNNSDTDGDRLTDGEEVLGAANGLNLPALGVNPLRKDILMEYDWFDDSVGCGAHSHRPSATAIARVTQAFADAPVQNPDGSTGINLINDYGQGGLFTGGNLVADADGDIDSVGPGDDLGPTYFGYKDTNFDSTRNGYFHYVLMPHTYNNADSSGYADIVGDDMIVSLYCSRSDTNVSQTIMHELGHNLGLRHGGDVNENHKPNYNSVMNYDYQFPGIDENCDEAGDGVIDFSTGQRMSLDESALDESVGMCNSVAIDWNGNGSIDRRLISHDLNDNFVNSVLGDFNDWANLFYGTPSAGTSPNAGQAPSGDGVACNNPAPPTP